MCYNNVYFEKEKKMNINIKNIGMIEKTIEPISFEGITVVAGKNNTGKSTISKLLYGVYHSLYNIETSINDYIKEQIRSYIFQLLPARMLGRFYRNRSLNEIIDRLLVINDKNCVFTELNKLIDENELDVDKDVVNETVEKVHQIIHENPNKIKNIVINNVFEDIFKEKINNMYNESDNKGQIEFVLKNKKILFEFSNNKLSNFQTETGSEKVLHDATYYDGPHNIDYVERFAVPAFDYQSDFYEKIRKKNKKGYDSIKVSESLADLFREFEKFGNLDIDFDEGAIRIKSMKEPISVLSLSNGLKTITMLKNLFLNGNIIEKDVLILDEPEINLHPEWQIVLAHILVLIQKRLSLTILISTHSPYFLTAIDTYAYIEKVQDKCRYYVAEEKKDSGGSVVRNVTEEIDEVYETLSQPYKELLDARRKYFDEKLV